MSIRLDFEENEIPILSDALQALPYNKVVNLIIRLQKQIDSQVNPQAVEAAQVVEASSES
jgi:hypothetical protein